jgi:hypothetical protein
MSGSGGMPSAGSAAPAERVLWSQTWTVAIHDPVTQPGYKDATMGLALDAGDMCKFGFNGSPSGTSQTFTTDGTCITAAGSLVSGVAVIFDKDGMNARGTAGRAALSGWESAVSGHTVKYLRRTQTYTIQLLGSAETSFNYADFTGKWEAVGY